MLMSAGVELPKKLFGHGFITKEGLKMGKSLATHWILKRSWARTALTRCGIIF